MQYESLTWDDKHKEDPTLSNDLCDCTLYAHRFSRHYWGKIPLPKLSDGELLQLQERDMLSKVLQEHKEKLDDNTGAFGSLFDNTQEAWSDERHGW